MTTDIPFDSIVSEELKTKGITTEAWALAQKRRRLKIEGAATHRPLRCSCGLMVFDLAEFAIHFDNVTPDERVEHKVTEA